MSLADLFELPKDSQRHRDFEYDMCEAKLLGWDGACQYLLSVMTGINQFAVSNDEFVARLRDFVVSRTSPAAAQFFDEGIHSVQYVGAYVERLYRRHLDPQAAVTLSKQDQAFELLLLHPDWSDAKIASQVSTTLKQLTRWREYRGLRTLQARAVRRAKEANEQTPTRKPRS